MILHKQDEILLERKIRTAHKALGKAWSTRSAIDPWLAKELREIDELVKRWAARKVVK